MEPVCINDRLYVDGAIGQEIPVIPLRDMGMDRVIAVRLSSSWLQQPTDIFEVVRRCVRIMNEHSQQSWRSRSDLVIEPEVSSNKWNDFAGAQWLIESGERAATRALPAIREWLQADATRAAHAARAEG